MPLQFSRKSAALVVSFCLVLAACSSKRTVTQTELRDTPLFESDSPETLLNEARNASPSRGAELYLQAAQTYWDSGLLGLALAAFNDVNIADLNPMRSSHWLELGLTLGTTFEDTALLQRLVDTPGLDLMTQQAPIEQQKNLTLLMSEALLALSRPIDAALVLAESRGIFSDSEIPPLNSQIWSAFSSAETSQLSRHTYTGTDEETRAWLQLVTELRLRQSSLEQQFAYLEQWQQEHPQHSASIYPPLELELLSRLPDISPTTVTLALPFSGPLANVAEAIRDGFLASYYHQPSAQQFSVSMFDTQTQDIETLYKDSSEQQLVIGPLDKARLERLTLLDVLPTPTLALNSTGPLDRSVSGLFQFSLSSEAEAEQVAQHLAHTEQLRIGVIAPDSEFGYRISDHFSKALSQAGGRTIATRFYQNQSTLSNAVSQLLATDRSRYRARKLRSITALPLESEPRRRQDIDAIFMVAKPEIARQLKPLFAFHYANKIPIYATSQVHGLDSQHNDDLDRVRFVEMPWMLSNSHPIKAQLLTHSPDTAAQYARFHALGADAHVLATRLPLMQQLPNSKVKGQSGTLSISPDGVVQRELEWATFKNGAAIASKE